MKMSDEELDIVIYKVLRRCPHSESDTDVAEKIASAIIQAEESSGH